MPGFNGTGPLGQGSLTGGGFGRCSTNSKVGMGRGGAPRGCGNGQCSGGSFGFRKFLNGVDADVNVEMLKKQKALIEQQIAVFESKVHDEK